MYMFKSAGIILFCIPDYKILLVQHKAGHWGFPKGGVEKHESINSAALRELKEETKANVNVVFDKPILSEQYSITIDGQKTIKKVIYVIGVTCDLNIRINARELLNVRWFTFKEAKQLEKFPSKKLLVKIINFLNQDRFHITIAPYKKKRGHYKQPIQGSKHLYSRIAPLALFNPKIIFSCTSKTIDTAVINKVISLTNNNADHIFIPREICKSSRSVIAIIPAILYRHKKVTFYHPQGCSIGERKIDVYLQIMEQFGVKMVHSVLN